MALLTAIDNKGFVSPRGLIHKFYVYKDVFLQKLSSILYTGDECMDISSSRIFSPDMPMGFDMALAKNELARSYFYALPEQSQVQIIGQANSIHSKEEMQAYADSLVKNSFM